MNQVTIRVPATTSNLGPGYDSLGVALQIENRVTTRRTDRSLANPMSEAVAERFFTASELAPFAFAWEIAGEVPQSRGLGSSVTVRLGLLHGLNELADRPLPGERLFEIAAALEGHPDNAAPAAFGGFTVAGGAEIARFEVAPELRFVLLIPDFEVSTPAAREVLPAQIDRLGAARSCANACRITAAFASRNYGMLRGSFEDHLHQPYRERVLIPFLSSVLRAGEDAGALGGFLSGSGSTICCLTLENADAVADAMLCASGNAGARTVITSADNSGVRISQ
ncbi:MAG TPA: homoserine kinase [Chthoniobacteraceae bacterium]|jgi:homoserine kinase|nr:homoserine kinase [Chthoniobacteraceae bacterium]